jgi:GWxTD domain-containing protein
MSAQQIKRWSVVSIFGLLMMSGFALAQDKPAADQNSAKGQQEVDPLKRPLTKAQQKENARKFKREVTDTYKKWLNEDVAYIITDEERQAFMALSNDEERDNFIEQFWQRRDPTPDTEENEYKEEHYRRIAYANEHFAAGVPGWRTDRGRMYIMYGKPDEIESHPAGGSYERPVDEGGGNTTTFPFEDWRYRYIEGIGQEIVIEFVDTCMCGEYHMTLDRGEKDALLNVPNAGLTNYEQLGLATKMDRFTTGGLERIGAGPNAQFMQGKEFDRLTQFAKLQSPPKVKFKDLEEVVTHRINVNLMPFDVRFDFVKVTSDTALVPVTIQIKNKDITFVNKDGVQRGTVNIFGRVTTLTGRIAQTFEDTVQVDVPSELLPKTVENESVYWKALPLRSGRYKIDIVLKDLNGDRTGSWRTGIMVPEYSDEKLASSSLILADLMEPAPRTSVGSGNFVIGTTKVRPRVESGAGGPASFRKNQTVNIWMQVYGLQRDKQTNKASATIEYDVVNSVTKNSVVHLLEDTSQMGNVGDQITLEKKLPLASLAPGLYQVTVTVKDKVSGQSVNPTAKFAVEESPTIASTSAAAQSGQPGR